MPRWSSTPGKGGLDKIRLITYPVMAGIGGLIFLFLTYHSFFYTQYIPISWEEKAVNVKDRPVMNLLTLLIFAAVAALLILIREKCPKEWLGKIETVAITFAVLWILALGFWWITSLDRVPEGDQAFIYGGASYFMEGDYSFFGHGCYCQIYPQQLGQIAMVELYFHLVGKLNYFAIEVICTFFAAGIVLLGYLILRRLKAGFVTKILYCFLMMGCFPLVGYTSWVYGDLPSTFFLFLAFFSLLCLQENVKWYIVACAAGSIVMACLVRKNSMICLVAFFILAFIDVISKKRWRMLITAIVSLTATILCYQMIYAVYEARSGQELGSGLPVNSWIAMGMQENWNGNGWYNNFPKELAGSLDWDFKAVEDASSEYLKERMKEFKGNPGQARLFFKLKVLSQWNEPLYQCLFFSQNYRKDVPLDSGSFWDQLYHEGAAFNRMLSWANGWQFLIYLGMLLYFAFAVGFRREPLEYLLAVTIIGGFFFSILWEAKARYVLPYYLMAYPLAVLGYAGLADRGMQLWKLWKERRENPAAAPEGSKGSRES